MPEIAHDFVSRHFTKEILDLAGRREAVVRGGRELFPRAVRALAPVRRIGVIGWGSQGPAQAQNLRDTLRGSDITVEVGLRPGSPSWQSAREAGFAEVTGTLGETFATIGRSDLVLLLISDAAQAELWPRIFAALRPGATLGLSHGFLLGHLDAVGGSFPAEVDVIAVCPKGMGPSVRRLYLQGAEIGGAGINASFAVHHDRSGHATDTALAWAIAIGAPYVFATTLRSEYVSDVYGERGILLGAVHGIVESLYRRYVAAGDGRESSFSRACECITGPISRTISRGGLWAVHEALAPADRAVFAAAYAATHPVATEVLHEIYDEVASGNEIRSVVLAGRRLERFPMGRIDGTETWAVGEHVRARRGPSEVAIDPFTAGVYCATMTAQIDVLLEHEHPWSEIANESVIEAVDSLNPFMHARGVAYMVDNCSTTARLGARKWAPRFDYALTQRAYPAFDRAEPTDREVFSRFLEHPVHGVLETCARFRPPIDIAVA